MAAIFDQGDGGSIRACWLRVCSALRLNRTLSPSAVRTAALAFLVLGMASLGAGRLSGEAGATLYDLCSARLNACAASEGPSEGDGGGRGGLMALFDADVTRDMIVDALDAMQQPRDAFKFLYGLIQEHCRVVPDDQPVYRIPRLTVEAVRRNQSQRVSDFQRGLGPG